MTGPACPILCFYWGWRGGWPASRPAVLGGIGSIRGAAVGGYVIGFIQVIVVASPLPSTFRDLVTFSLLLIILTLRPMGLFGVARRAKV